MPQSCGSADWYLMLRNGIRITTSYPNGVTCPFDSYTKSGLRSVVGRPVCVMPVLKLAARAVRLR